METHFIDDHSFMFLVMYLTEGSTPLRKLQWNPSIMATLKNQAKVS